MRLRLRLALIGAAILPVAVGFVLRNVPNLHLPLLAVLLVLVVLVACLVMWMSHQVLRPAEELERSREELARLFASARAASLEDALTGLGNHRAFQEELARQVETYDRYKVPVSLLVIDLDDLKVVNDSQGHLAGDQVLRDVGALIRSVVRYTDRAFRLGGDEFAILMPHTQADAALSMGRRLLKEALTPAQGRSAIAFSAGVSACPALATTRDELYAQADAALYWCKRHGRSAVDVFDAARVTIHPGLTSQSAPLGQAISTGLLRAVYQPVVDLRTGMIVSYEGLIRPTPESGYSNPGELFAAAEQQGRAVELDYACIETILAQAAGLGEAQMLSVNVSPRTVEGPQFSAEWLAALARTHGLPPSRVTVELTEQQSIEDLPRLQRNLAALQRAGIRVAIDDLGAGNAGLRLLSQFRFDTVKIDLSLVQDGAERDSSRAVLASLKELAGRWNAYVIAEGIETVAQLRAVREIGVAAGQGFLLGRPMTAPTLRSVDLASIAAGDVTLQALRAAPAAPQLMGRAAQPAFPTQ